MVGQQHFGVNSNISEDDEIQRRVHEEINKSSSENEDANSTENQLLKRKRYHRHTSHQIQEMEAQRKEISQELGMEPLQVKFWFQNKRTQMKSKHERQENTHLRAENEKLRMENMRYREALNNACCPACGGMATIGDMSHDERHLRIENARLREEIDRISSIAAKYVVSRSQSLKTFPLLLFRIQWIQELRQVVRESRAKERAVMKLQMLGNHRTMHHEGKTT
ncbi:UNVERIFIED_CONTAM: Homeobox-leucine zipper protein ROC2 [Sesamum angustifolium]|uniref:Homeobox-leucine zipper protein ROC2 n=1 Tax=Sesamum angustifolium TaxID=2727405 RepID=A0AAW2PG58_9LAMI